MQKSEYNNIEVGMTIKLKTKEQLLKEGNELDECGDLELLDGRTHIVKEMFEYLGKEFEIYEKHKLELSNDFCVVLVGADDWVWFHDAIECIVE